MSYNVKTEKVIIMLTILVSLVSSANIIPDPQNPLQMMGPTNYWAGQSLVFRFMLRSWV